jgi:hypothetical protein
MQVRLAVLGVPTTLGDYTVEARFVPTADEAWVVTARLPLKVTTLDPTAIQWRREWTVRCARWQERAELMNVNTNGKYELFFRTTSLEPPPEGGVTLMRRIETVDKGTTVAAAPQCTAFDSIGWEFWLTFDKGSDLVFMRIGYVAGETLERTVLKARQARPPNE